MTDQKKSEATGKDRHGIFADVIPVYTASSGTQYVLPTDILFDSKEIDQFLDQLREKHAKKD